MNERRITALTIAIIAIVTTVLFLWQQSQWQRLKEEWDTRDMSAVIAQIEKKPSQPEPIDQSELPAATISPSPADAKRSLDVEPILARLTERMITGDQLGLILAVAPLMRLGPEELGEVMDELPSFEKSHARDWLFAILTMMPTEEEHPSKTLSRFADGGVDVEIFPYEVLRGWASESPVEALEWFHEKFERGAIEEMGRYVNPSSKILRSVIDHLGDDRSDEVAPLLTESSEEFRSLMKSVLVAAHRDPAVFGLSDEGHE